MNIYISIVSHGHDLMIMENPFLKEISNINGLHIAIKDNVCSNDLKSFSLVNNIHYIDREPYSGFGKNNNIIFDYFSPNAEDWFLVVNPDVIITKEQMMSLIHYLEVNTEASLFCINLFKDSECRESENSVRMFPSFLSLFSVLLGKPFNRPYNQLNLKNFDVVDWASGAFLIFRCSLYKKLNGFDVSYHMYYEDVDLCYRLKQQNQPLKFLKGVKAVHKGEYKNRSVFSKHFRWYLNSLFKFLETQRVS